MTRHRLLAVVAAGALPATSAGGSGFDDNDGGSTAQQSTGPANPPALIAPSGDAETKALAAARELASRLREEVELDAGIGVSAGSVVAGNIGDERRLEYTVIGDPVNEAARLTELAKEQPSRVLASGGTVADAAEEGRNWSLGEEVTVRGRSAPTRLASPAAPAPAPRR